MTRISIGRRAALVISSVVLTGVGAFQSPALAAEGSWEPTGSLNVPRQQATVTQLDNGRTLVAGGRDFALTASIASAELYNPLTEAFTLTGSMTNARWSHTATLLLSGKVLVAGGFTDPTTGANAQPVLDTAEIYDPATGVWTPTGPMSTRRALHVAELLPDGRVLVAGGRTCNGPPPLACNSTFTTNTAEIFNPSTGTWTPTASMNSNRTTTSAVRLTDGRVLVPAGFPGGQNTAETYNPPTGTWTNTGLMNANRARQGAMLLPDGTALVAGGSTGPGTHLTSDTYNPATNTWTPAGNVLQTRFNYFFTELPNGDVLIAGGANAAATSAEVYDPATRTWSDAGTMPNSHGSGSSNGNSTRTAVISADGHRFVFNPQVCGDNCGKVLVVGDNPTGAAELYMPAQVSLAACTTTITGSTGPVVVPTGQVTCITNALVEGSVEVRTGGALVITNSRVSGGVLSQGAAGVRICGSQITVPRGSGPSLPGVSVVSSFGPVVVGDGTPACPRNDIVRGVTLYANQSVELDGNRVSGDVRVEWTAGTSVIAANQVTLGLTCLNNLTPPTNEGRPNQVVGARTGQCAAL